MEIFKVIVVITAVITVLAAQNFVIASEYNGSNVSTENNSLMDDFGRFTVVTTLYGITNQTGNGVVLVNVGNLSNGVVINASSRDLLDGKADGVTDIGIAFHNVTIPVGQKFIACAMIFFDAKLLCKDGRNAPGTRTEFADILIR